MTRRGRRILAGLQLLDHQIVDRDGWMAGKVDDLELEVPTGGGLPVVTAILSGPGALAAQLGGRLGRWLESAWRRLSDAPGAQPARIDWRVVDDLGTAVVLAVGAREVASDRFEAWTRRYVVDRIPGARRAPE